MKNRKILFFVSVVFFCAMFFLNLEKAFAVQCEEVGTCQTRLRASTCPSGNIVDESITNCKTDCQTSGKIGCETLVCCVPQSKDDVCIKGWKGICAGSSSCPSETKPMGDLICNDGYPCCEADQSLGDNDCPETESFCFGKSIGDSCFKGSEYGECAGRDCDEEKLYCAVSEETDCSAPSICRVAGCNDDETETADYCVAAKCCKPKGDTPLPPLEYTPKRPSTEPMWKVNELGAYQMPKGTITAIVKGVLNWLLYIFGFVGIIAFVISGIMYLTAGGDAEQEKKAKLAMKMGIMGIVVGLIGFIVLQAVDAALNATNLF